MQKFIAILLITFLLNACKKKKDEAATTPDPAQTNKDITIKIDGLESACNSCSYSYVSGPGRGITFDFPDSEDLILLNFYMRPLVGAYPIVKGNFSYQNQVTLSIKKDGIYYSAVTGSINVTASDTTNEGAIKRLQAGLAFVTDTVNGKSIKVTEGVIDFTKK